MKTKTYRNKKVTCKGYMRNVGNGTEIGFVYGKRPVFVGNFVRSSEATRWWTIMNQEIRNFGKRFKVAPKKCPTGWYGHFLGCHLYNQYYNFLDKCFTVHTRTYKTAVTRDLRTYRRLNRTWYPAEKTTFLKAA